MIPIPPNEVDVLETVVSAGRDGRPVKRFTGRLSWAWREYFINREQTVDAGADAAAGSGDLSGASADAAISLAMALDLAPMQDLDVNAMLAVLPGLRSWSEFQAIRNTRALRAGYAAGEFPGCFYVETDPESHLVYQSDGTTWIYVGGIWTDVLANLLTGLGADDEGLQYEVSDYDHVLRWNGAAWTWGPLDTGSGWYFMSEIAPNSIGGNSWQICDGSTVARLNPDGTTTNVTVPNCATPRYLKGATAAAAIAGYSGNTPSGTNAASATGAPSATTTVDNDGLGSTVAVGSGAHTHTAAAQVFTGNAMTTLELPNKQVRLYYRR